MLTPNKDANQFIDNNGFNGSFKGGLIANMTSSNINISSVKNQQNSQFFGNRNNKNKFHSDVVKNTKHIGSENFNNRKLKFTQGLEIEHK